MVNRWVAALIVFIEAGAVLVLEILSVRLLAPYVGLTLETTTSIIGAVLLGIALGAGIGGYIADRTDPRKLIAGLLIGGGLLALLTVPIVRWLGPTTIGSGTTGALEITLIALVPVAAVLSAISPTVAHWRLRDLHSSGAVVGGLSAWATAGALVGTFGTGYVLVPLFPVGGTVFGVGAVLVMIGVIFAVSMRVLTINTVIGVIILVACADATELVIPHPCQTETDYHCVNVTTVPGYPSGRYLYLDTERNSFVDLSNPSDLGTFHYYHWIAEAIEARYPNREPLSMVNVGGGALALPRWLQATRPGSKSVTLEVDGQLVSFDKRYLRLRTNAVLRVVIGDARLTVRRVPAGSADVVVGDAFSGLTVPWQLTTVQWLEEVRRVLKPNGFYAMNIVDHYPLSLLRAEIATMRTVFSHVRLITKQGKNDLPAGGNTVLLASDVPLPISEGIAYGERAVIKLEADPDLLTDNYAPVDQLQTR